MSSSLDLGGARVGLPALPGMDRVTLCVSGGRPLRLRAELLAECSSWAPNASAWQELTLHRCEGDGFAVAIRTCRGTSGDSDVFHARVFAELDGALAWLQGFDPTADLGSDLDAADRRVSATEIALRAATLRQRADRVQLQYRSMVGELLYRLDADD